MRSINLSCGEGKQRISRYLSGKPKCTVDIGNGLCLIRYTVELLKSRGISEIGIVLGYRAQVIRDVLKDCSVKFYVNPFYDVTNSIASAWFAGSFVEEAAQAGEDLMIMNGDVYMEEALLDQILAEKKSPVMFADETREGDGGLQVFLRKRRPEKIRKRTVRGRYYRRIHWNRTVFRLFPALLYRADEPDDRRERYPVWWENVLYEMTRERDVYVQDVGGRFWAEVDYIEDYERILEHRNIERIIPAQLEILRPGNQERSENEF